MRPSDPATLAVHTTVNLENPLTQLRSCWTVPLATLPKLVSHPRFLLRLAFRPDRQSYGYQFSATEGCAKSSPNAISSRNNPVHLPRVQLMNLFRTSLGLRRQIPESLIS